MLLRKPIVALVVAVGCCAFGVEIAACSSSSAPSGPPTPVSSCVDGGLTVAFSPMYSAFDGTHTFTVPALVVGSSTEVTWTVSDPTMVGIQADKERPNEILVTMLKAGQVLVNVQSDDGKCGSSLLTITPTAESDWEIGNARYNDGTSLHLSAGATGGTGSPLEQGNGGPACTSCHGETATNGPFTDVSHTPEQTGGFSDSDILNIVLHGDFPDGGYFDSTIVTYAAWHNFHRWTDITSDQQKGIIAYLRSLTPRPQKGAVNFPAFDTDSGGGDNEVDATVQVDAGPASDASAAGDASDAGAASDASAASDAGAATDATPGLDASTDDAALDASDAGATD